MPHHTSPHSPHAPPVSPSARPRPGRPAVVFEVDEFDYLDAVLELSGKWLAEHPDAPLRHRKRLANLVANVREEIRHLKGEKRD